MGCVALCVTRICDKREKMLCKLSRSYHEGRGDIGAGSPTEMHAKSASSPDDSTSSATSHMSATEESDTRGQPVTVKLKADALFGKLGSGPFSLRGQKIIIIWIELSASILTKPSSGSSPLRTAWRYGSRPESPRAPRPENVLSSTRLRSKMHREGRMRSRTVASQVGQLEYTSCHIRPL